MMVFSIFSKIILNILIPSLYIELLEFVSYHPNIGASDDELTKICDDIYQTLMGAFVAKMMM